LFLIQVVTGIALTFYYVPSPDHAYESVKQITEEVSFGWWIRGIHRWSSNLMIVAVILHLMRVFFTGAYRKPRELNWLVGIGLLLTTLTFGFTGYSLLYEQLSYWGAVVGTNIAQATPLVGSHIATFLRGGEEVNPNTLTRLFVLHIGVLPTVMFFLIGLHIFFIRIHGVTELEGGEAAHDPRRHFPFLPDHFLTELIMGVFLIFLVSQLALIFPVSMGEPADPVLTPEHIKPEWYFYPVFRWLKLFSFEAGVAGVIALVGIMFIWPFIDQGLQRLWPGRDMSVYIGMVAVVLMITFSLWEWLSR
jgi:quinol-cytochrome oxidoreductase complex cytochrome b subunit